jgi:hypothetical protein
MPTSLQRETAELVRLADRDLTRLWRLVANGAAADEALHDLLPAIVREYGTLGAALAAEMYDQQREKAGARGRYFAAPIAADDRGSHALVGAAVAQARDDSTLKTLILGGVQRRIADHVRLTTANNAVADAASEGWMRVGEGGCKSGWCDQYLDGEVRTVEGYDFDAHDFCKCDVVSVFY